MPQRNSGKAVWLASLAALTVGVVATAAILNLTLNDFELTGTQVGMVSPLKVTHSQNCLVCHADFSEELTAPGDTWRGSLMAQAGRDPLFFAQMTLANQDVSNAGYFCMRCHVPFSFITGHALQTDGTTLDDRDKDGISCHFCHSMLDPIYRPGVSPIEDESILQSLGVTPQYYGNSQFVLDPSGVRRGPRADAAIAHTVIQSDFHERGNMCGTCHEVGNVAISRQPNGTYRYNAIDTPTPNENPHTQFPLERTFSEWSLSSFANGGVDMHGRFGGGEEGGGVVESCQDCHMPETTGYAAWSGLLREDLVKHEFAGGAAHALDLIAAFTQGNPDVDQASIIRSRAAAVSMLERAASVELTQENWDLRVRVINESGHKLPTGHIEGRRVWVNVRFLNAAGSVVTEFGAYDSAQAELDTASTKVYEMHVGLSEDAAALTGLPAGPTSRMTLADTIVEDNRIPPRGFNNSAYEAAGAPAVACTYADGQYWDDTLFPVPPGAVSAEVRLFYQQTPKEYIEHLRNANVTDNWGRLLYSLWEQTGRGEPILMLNSATAVLGYCPADYDLSGGVDGTDVQAFFMDWENGVYAADTNQDGSVDGTDVQAFFMAWEAGGC
ncbi:MAG: hypothetical protein JSR77_00865 [Planctomycetes bacterium]|nr:hypothetical protein [Planctomycetota bacterium]